MPLSRSRSRSPPSKRRRGGFNHGFSADREGGYVSRAAGGSWGSDPRRNSQDGWRADGMNNHGTASTGQGRADTWHWTSHGTLWRDRGSDVDLDAIPQGSTTNLTNQYAYHKLSVKPEKPGRTSRSPGSTSSTATSPVPGGVQVLPLVTVTEEMKPPVEDATPDDDCFIVKEEKPYHLESEIVRPSWSVSPQSQSDSSSQDCTDDLTLARVEGQEPRPQPRASRAKKIFTPDESKDSLYWMRRKKNNLAAKRSQDARRVKENKIVMRASFYKSQANRLRKELIKSEEENSELRKQNCQLRKRLEGTWIM